MKIPSWTRLLAAMAVASVGVLSLSDANAQPVTVRSLTVSGDDARASLEIGLGSLREAVREQGPRALRDARPDLFQGFEWGNFRFSNLRVVVSGVESAVAGPNELRVTVRAVVHADRERLEIRWRGIHSRTEWTPNGERDIADLTAIGRITVAFDTGPVARLDVLLDSASGTWQLNPVRGLQLGTSFGGRSIHQRQERITLPGLVPDVAVPEFRLTGVAGDQATAEALLRAPAGPPEPEPTP